MSDADEREITATRAENDDVPRTSIPLVGIGVCARSLQSLEQIFRDIGEQTGAAYLVAVRQQEGLDVSTVLDVLRRQSPLPVFISADKQRIEPNKIYVGGPDDMVTIEDGHLRVQPATEPLAHRGTIDTMLISLAEHAQDRAIAIILAGLGSDGTAGVTATKKCGGLSVAETDPFRGNDSEGVAGPSGAIDLHLPAEKIASQVVLYLSNQEALGGFGPDQAADEVEAQVAQITTILRSVTGHDFHGYKRGTFLRRVHRRLHVLQIDSVEAYVSKLGSDRQEVQDLFQDLLIGVTQFFRDPREFEMLERELPRLFEGKEADDQFRVWVLGCATGEEAYSIAILLREHMNSLARPPQVQIFATDLDARALGIARAGRYSASAIQDHVRPDRLQRWFVKEGETYCVSKELREMCIFSPHNLVKDVPFSRIDILSCRNLLIYLNTDLQNRVIPIFHFSLVSGGILFLGSSENVTRHQKLFAPTDRRNRIFRRLETAVRIVPDFPLSSRGRGHEPQLGSSAGPLPAPRISGGISRTAEAIAERYAPAYVVVDTQGDILHFSGRTGRFLEPLAGVASLNVVNLVHRDLRIDLRSAIHRALADGRRVELTRLLFQQEDRVSAANIIVEPIGGGDVTSLVILFQDAGSVSESGIGGEQLQNGDHVERLEGELRLTRDRLQATIEELESTNEELKSSNEEYQSINEELQSANEEMETSKEELQSVNEELQTVNGELAHRVAELGRSNSDLKNLLEATQIATLFLDNEMRVRSFTPSATEIFYLLDTDVGRPLGHVVSRVAYPEIHEDVRKVVKTLSPINRMVLDADANRRFAVKVLPYRSLDNYISGAVVTFTDLTAVHQAEAASRESEARLQALLSASSQIIFRMNADWSEMIEMEGKGFLSETQESAAWVEQHIPEADQATVREALGRAVQDGAIFELEHRIRRTDGSTGWVSTRAVPIRNNEGSIIEWFGAASDITDRQHAEQALRESEDRLQSLVVGLPQLVWRAVDGGKWTWASQQWTDYTGQSSADSHGWGWLDHVHPDDRSVAEDAWAHAEAERQFTAEYRIREGATGIYRWFQTRATPLRDERGRIIGWFGTSTDIDNLRQLQERQQVLVRELQHRTFNLMGMVRSTADTTIRSSVDLSDFRAKFQDRIEALARVQRLLSKLGDDDRVSFGDLIHAEFDAIGVLETGEKRVSLEGPHDVALRSSTVQTFAMALHELATNAVKYGALHQPGGHLHVRWWVDTDGRGEPWLHVDWRETGVVMPSDGAAAQGTGQGRALIEKALPYQLNAKTTYVMAADGVRCSIALPISKRGQAEAYHGAHKLPHPRS